MDLQIYNEYWNNFLHTGYVEDYLKYVNSINRKGDDFIDDDYS